MDEGVFVVLIVGITLIGLPWLVMHYITRWKTAPTLTQDDEELLDDLYRIARKLEERLETVERLVAADNPDFRPEPRSHAPRIEQDRRIVDDAERLYSRGTTQ